MTDAWKTAANIGNILLRRCLITPTQLASAIQKQQEARARKEEVLLGQVCVQMGLCTQAILDECLEEQARLLAPPRNEGEVANVLDNLDAAVRKATKSSTRMKAVSDRTESAFAFTKVRD